MRLNCRIMSAWLTKQSKNLIFCFTLRPIVTESGDFGHTYCVTVLWHHMVHGVAEKDDSADKLLCWGNDANCSWYVSVATCTLPILLLATFAACFMWHRVRVKQRISYGRSQLTVLTVLLICVYWPLALFCFFSSCFYLIQIKGFLLLQKRRLPVSFPKASNMQMGMSPSL